MPEGGEGRTKMDELQTSEEVRGSRDGGFLITPSVGRLRVAASCSCGRRFDRSPEGGRRRLCSRPLPYCCSSPLELHSLSAVVSPPPARPPPFSGCSSVLACTGVRPIELDGALFWADSLLGVVPSVVMMTRSSAKAAVLCALT